MKAGATAMVLALLAAAVPASAHEIGKTQATATLQPDGAYIVDIVVDPDSLLTVLDVASGVAATPPASREDRDRRITAHADLFLSRVSLRLDEVAIRPAFDYHPQSAFGDYAQAPSTVRLTGRAPAGARSLSFAYGLASGAYALNVRLGDSEPRTVWIDGTADSGPVSLAPRPPAAGMAVSAQYLALGFTHILPRGVDHILFVLGIFLLGVRWRSVFLQVSTFTIAHSITLGLTMYGIVSLPARVVEPMIALSIAYVAIENLLTSELKPWRLALVFSFGLLHGMGFAGVLRDLGLPRSQFLNALLSFNVGVEAGKLTVIALAFGAVAYWRGNHPAYRRLVVLPASFAIAIVGLYWTIERAFGMV